MHTVVFVLIALSLAVFAVFFARLDFHPALVRRRRGVGAAPVTRDEQRTRRDAIRSALREALQAGRLGEFSAPPAGVSRGRFRALGGAVGEYRILRESQADDLYVIELETSPEGEGDGAQRSD